MNKQTINQPADGVINNSRGVYIDEVSTKGQGIVDNNH